MSGLVAERLALSGVDVESLQPKRARNPGRLKANAKRVAVCLFFTFVVLVVLGGSVSKGREALRVNLPNERADSVREAIAWAWDGYVKYAWTHDELRPLSRSGMDSFCASGATIVDSLSTLWLANMPERFAVARSWIADMDFSRLRDCNLFESNIRSACLCYW